MKYKEIAEIYFEDNKATMKPASYYNTRYMYEKYIADYWNEQDISGINSREAQKYYNHVSKITKADGAQLLAEHTVKDIVALFKTICYYAMREGIMHEFAFKLRKPYGIREKDEARPEYMPEEICKKLIEICTSDIKKYSKAKIFTLLAMTTGLRIGEACGLRWEDIDFEAQTAKIKRTVERIYDGDSKSTYLHIGDPKTKTSKRIIYLPDVLVKALKEYLEYKGGDDADYILGKKVPAEPRTIRQGYTRFIKVYEIEYVHPHALRHTFCTNALSNGCDIKMISNLLGHSNTQITLNVYTHITSQQQRDTMNKLNKLFGGS